MARFRCSNSVVQIQMLKVRETRDRLEVIVSLRKIISLHLSIDVSECLCETIFTSRSQKGISWENRVREKYFAIAHVSSAN